MCVVFISSTLSVLAAGAPGHKQHPGWPHPSDGHLLPDPHLPRRGQCSLVSFVIFLISRRLYYCVVLFVCVLFMQSLLTRSTRYIQLKDVFTCDVECGCCDMCMCQWQGHAVVLPDYLPVAQGQVPRAAWVWELQAAAAGPGGWCSGDPTDPLPHAPLHRYGGWRLTGPLPPLQGQPITDPQQHVQLGRGKFHSTLSLFPSSNYNTHVLVQSRIQKGNITIQNHERNWIQKQFTWQWICSS